MTVGKWCIFWIREGNSKLLIPIYFFVFLLLDIPEAAKLEITMAGYKIPITDKNMEVILAAVLDGIKSA